MEKAMDKCEVEYEIVLKFGEFSKVASFLGDLENWLKYKQQKSVKKENDQRGKHTAMYHEKVRKYRVLHPELSYRECLKKLKNDAIL